MSPARTVKVAATQMACSEVKEANLANAIKLVREAAGKGAQIILLQELFHGLYFCQVKILIACTLCWLGFTINLFILGTKRRVFRMGNNAGRERAYQGVL